MRHWLLIGFLALAALTQAQEKDKAKEWNVSDPVG